MADIAIHLHIGPTSADQHALEVPAERPLGDLITGWKKDYHLAEQDRQGEMIRYALYRELKGAKVQVDLAQSLRSLRFQAHQILYLTNARHLWWPSNPSLSPSPAKETAPLNPKRLSNHQTALSSPAPTPVGAPIYTAPRPTLLTPCSLELAPGCVRQIGEAGVVINREYLLQELPPSVRTRERALVLIGLASRLSAVSRGNPGHCSLLWRQSWYLIAHSSLYIGSTRHSHNEAIQVDQTVTVLLGREGWPLTIRLHSTIISR